jgi:nicotinate-nucleotide pyrophosphorylase (carboxylating)
MNFSEHEMCACRHLVELALEEDLGDAGDITSKAIIPPRLEGRAAFVARTAGIVAGLPAADMVFQTAHTPLVKFQPLVADGARVAPGERLAVVSGLMEFILTGERTALNFLQHLSGIATLTRSYVDAVADLPCKILDTRKTLPGWRLLQKYAVRCGGGHNHRMGLHDGMLVKDNHLAALGKGAEAFRKLFDRKSVQPYIPPLEVEVDDLQQLEWALAGRPSIILLDNMSHDDLRRAVAMRNANAPKTLLEASGGVTLQTVRAIAETGVDRISIGALTHSAPALDIGLDYEEPER